MNNNIPDAEKNTPAVQEAPQKRDMEEVLWNYIDEQAKEATSEAVGEERETGS